MLLFCAMQPTQYTLPYQQHFLVELRVVIELNSNYLSLLSFKFDQSLSKC